MFELCNAAIACLGIAIGSFTMQSVSLSTPCNLQKPSGKRRDSGKVIKCRASLLNGRIDLSSITGTFVAQQSGQIHLSGTSGQLQICDSKFFNATLGTYKQERGPLSLPSKARMRLPKTDVSTTCEIVYEPNSLPQHKRHPSGTFFESMSRECKQACALRQMRPTSTAVIPTGSIVKVHDDGYTTHPAVLDAVTHTAAALDFEPFLKEHQPSAFLCIKILHCVIDPPLLPSDQLALFDIDII